MCVIRYWCGPLVVAPCLVLVTPVGTHNHFRLGTHLGSGQFGVVHRGVWLSSNGEVKVAVKTLKEGSGEEDRVKFLQEAAIMGQFKHPNVVTMYGVVIQGEPVSAPPPPPHPPKKTVKELKYKLPIIGCVTCF